MFKFMQIGETRGDCTTPYAVVLDKEYTVEEFVQAVVSRTDEWGYIGIDDGKLTIQTLFGNPKCEYFCGRLRSMLPEEILQKKISAVKADGGWSNMDYLLTLCE